jgi:hypothetical protein
MTEANASPSTRQMLGASIVLIWLAVLLAIWAYVAATDGGVETVTVPLVVMAIVEVGLTGYVLRVRRRWYLVWPGGKAAERSGR